MRKKFLLCSAQGFGEGIWEPSVDVYRTGKGWLLKVDLAGVRLDDIQLSTHKSILTIQGVRRDVIQEGCRNYYSLEISYNRFKRCVTLPVDVENAALQMDYKDGMLFIRVESKE